MDEYQVDQNILTELTQQQINPDYIEANIYRETYRRAAKEKFIKSGITNSTIDAYEMIIKNRNLQKAKRSLHNKPPEPTKNLHHWFDNC